MNDLYWIAAVLVLALIYTAAGFRGILSSGRGMRNLWLWMLLLLAVQTAALAGRGVSWDCCPIRGIPEVLFFMGWALNAFYLILGRQYRMSVLGIFTAPAIACCTAGTLLTWHTVGFVAPGNAMLTWHIGFAMIAYGAFGLAAIAGFVFLVQDHFLKGRKVMGTSKKLPPVRTLQSSMVRLVTIGFLLLAASQVFGYATGFAISGLKVVLAPAITLSYLALLLVIYIKGMPGRMLSWCCVLVYAVSLSIFFVLK